MEISLTWQDLIARTRGVFQVVTTGVGKLASPKFPSISERRDLGFLVFKADYLFLRFLDVYNSHDCFGEPLISFAVLEAGQSCSYSEVCSVGN